MGKDKLERCGQLSDRACHRNRVGNSCATGVDARSRDKTRTRYTGGRDRQKHAKD